MAGAVTCSFGLPIQELTSLREQLLAAESATAGAVKECTQLRQQLRSLQSKSHSQAPSPEHAELTRQVTPVIDQLLKETYTALRDEFQADVTYKVRSLGSFELHANDVLLYNAGHALQTASMRAYVSVCLWPSCCVFHTKLVSGNMH